jgi:hypothetical protein
VEKQTVFQTKTEDRLDYIESALNLLNASQAPGKLLTQLASLDTKRFTQNLTALRKVSEQPVANVATTPEVLKKVAYQLNAVDEKTDNYWPTVLRFIEFASAGLASNAPPKGSLVTRTFTKESGKDGQSPLLGGFILNGGVFVLDGAVLQDIRFVEARIIFTDNPSTLKNVTFINCAFEFPDIDRPSPALEIASRALLASDFKSASGE